MKKIMGPTPNGGDYAILYYYDAQGNETTPENAVNSIICEFDKEGKLIYETFGSFDKENSQINKNNIDNGEGKSNNNQVSLCEHYNSMK